MEQRKGQNLTPPVTAAATDPAYVPGLMAPRDAEPEDAAPEEAAAAESVPEDAVPVEEAASDDVTSDEAASDTDADDGEGEAADPESEAESEGESGADVVSGPVFEASDRRASITVDGGGVWFTLDDQEAEWHWDEISAVEYATPRFGRRFTVTVHTPNGRWYPAEVEAPARGRLKEWTAQLDQVLDAHFDDGDA